jgi:hypothetical protein
MGSGDSETLRQALEAYIAAHPELSDRTMQSYRKDLERALPLQMDQPVRRLIAPEVLRLNKERLEELSRRDPVNKPPNGFWSWQLTLRTLRTVLCWRAAQKEQPSPWPDRRALKIKSAPGRRELCRFEAHPSVLPCPHSEAMQRLVRAIRNGRYL